MKSVTWDGLIEKFEGWELEVRQLLRVSLSFLAHICAALCSAFTHTRIYNS